LTEEVLRVINLWHLDGNLIRKWFGDSLSSTDVSWQHNLDLDTHDSLWEIDVSDSMVDVVVLWLTSGDEVTLFVLLDLGSLLSELTGDDDLATSDFLDLHDVSDDEHGSGSDWGLLHHFGLEELDLGTSGERLVEDNVELDDDVSLGESISSLDELFELVGSLTIGTGGSSSVDDLDGKGKVGGRLLDDKSGVASTDQGSFKELMDFSLEDSVGNEKSSLREESSDLKVRVVDGHRL
jgi:hypothetical protein